MQVPVGDYEMRVEGEANIGTVLVRGSWSRGDFLTGGGTCASRHGAIVSARTGQQAVGRGVFGVQRVDLALTFVPIAAPGCLCYFLRRRHPSGPAGGFYDGPMMMRLDGQEEGRLFINNNRGELIIVKPSPDGYREIGRTNLIEPTSPPQYRRQLVNVNWTYPEYANRHICARNDEEIICASLAADGS